MIINLVLVEDHQLFREVLITFLHRTPDIRVIGQASSGDALLELMKTLRPHVILLDLDMTGLAYVEQLSSMHPLVPVLAFSRHDAQAYAEQAKLMANVRGYLPKQIGSAYFLEIVRAVVANESARARERSGAMVPIGPRRSAPAELLSRQEVTVLKLMLAQLSNEEIAARLSKSIRTIEGHRTNIYQKTGARTLVGVVQYALEYGIVSQEELKALVFRKG